METALRLDAAAPGLVRKQRREAQDILALSYSYQNQYDKARAVYQEAMAKDPLYPGFPYNLACVCALAGDRPAALSALRTALANDAKADPGPSLPDPAADEDLKGPLGRAGLSGDPDREPASPAQRWSRRRDRARRRPPSGRGRPRGRRRTPEVRVGNRPHDDPGLVLPRGRPGGRGKGHRGRRGLSEGPGAQCGPPRVPSPSPPCAMPP